MSKKMRNIFAILLSSSMMLSLVTGCSGSIPPADKTTPEGGDASTTTPTETKFKPGIVPVKAGEVEMDAEQYVNSYMGSEPSTLDPTKASDTYASTIITNTMEPLLRVEEDADAKNFIAGAGAEKWESSEDGTVWTFHLRDNTWTDGVAVTANDYAYSMKRTIDPTTGSPNSFMMAPIKNAAAVMEGTMGVDELGIKAIDDKTLEITLENPTSYFESLMCTKVSNPVRQDIVEKHGEKFGAEMETLVFCGPFQMQSWTHNNEIILSKNESYWDKDRVHLQTINFKIIADENAMLNSFDNNSFDTVKVSKKDWLERFKQKEGVSYVTYVYPAVRFDFYNTSDPLFKNANIRKAFTLGIDREELADVIYQGTMEPAYSWVPKNVLAGELGEYRSLVEEPLVTLKTEYPDPKTLLLKGMEELGLGTDPSTIKATLSLGGTDQWMRTYAEYLQQTYKKTLGINLEIEFNEWPTFSDKVTKGEYQIGYMSWGQDYNDPMDMLTVGSAKSGSVANNWENPKYEELLVQARKEMDAQKRLDLYAEAEKILIYEDGVFCPIVNEKVNNFRYDYLKNMTSTPFETVGYKYLYTSGR